MYKREARALPSKADPAAVSHAITKNLARKNSIPKKNCPKFLLEVSEYMVQQINDLQTYHFGQSLWQIRNIQIGGAFITFGLQSRVKGFLNIR